jgi:hypothetical protein
MQKLLQPAQEQREVVAGGGEHGVGTVTLATLEIIAVHAVIALQMADHRLDGRAAAHLATNGSGDASHLTRKSTRPAQPARRERYEIRGKFAGLRQRSN